MIRIWWKKSNTLDIHSAERWLSSFSLSLCLQLWAVGSLCELCPQGLTVAVFCWRNKPAVGKQQTTSWRQCDPFCCPQCFTVYKLLSQVSLFFHVIMPTDIIIPNLQMKELRFRTSKFAKGHLDSKSRCSGRWQAQYCFCYTLGPFLSAVFTSQCLLVVSMNKTLSPVLQGQVFYRFYWCKQNRQCWEKHKVLVFGFFPSVQTRCQVVPLFHLSSRNPPKFIF